MPIKIKLPLGFLILIVLMIIMGVLNYNFSLKIEKTHMKILEGSMPIIHTLRDIKSELTHFEASLIEYSLFTEMPEEIDHMKSEIILHENKFKDLFKDYESLISQYFPHEKPIMLEIKSKINLISQEGIKLKSLKGENPDQTKIINQWKQFEKIENSLLENIDKAIEYENEELEATHDYAHILLEQLLYSIILTGLATILLAIILAIFLSISILKPLEDLTKATEKIGQGVYDIKIKIKSKDEIGILANSFRNMAAKLKLSEQKNKKYSDDLQNKIKELEKFTKIAVGRELKMIELKKRIKELGG